MQFKQKTHRKNAKLWKTFVYCVWITYCGMECGGGGDGGATQPFVFVTKSVLREKLWSSRRRREEEGSMQRARGMWITFNWSVEFQILGIEKGRAEVIWWYGCEIENRSMFAFLGSCPNIIKYLQTCSASPAVDANVNGNVRKLSALSLPHPIAQLVRWQQIRMWLRLCVFEFVPIYWHIITSGTMKAVTMHKERSGRSLIYQWYKWFNKTQAINYDKIKLNGCWYPSGMWGMLSVCVCVQARWMEKQIET